MRIRTKIKLYVNTFLTQLFLFLDFSSEITEEKDSYLILTCI